ncbi:hypothetical protein ACFQ3S_03320 [Mucilaginibacter terrae]|uniref:hypothetical protein n=1 Tax=Mucilaginibacter terrae TaxID=1955052 RepID=UPI003640852E
MLNKIKYSRLAFTISILLFIAFLGYFVAFANVESGDSNNFFIRIIVATIVLIFKIIALPGLLFLEKLGISMSWFYIAAVVIDCVIYGFIAEILFIKFRNKPQKASA